MTKKIFKFSVITICFLIISVAAQSAKAASIREISIPMLGATYDYSTKGFEISGLSTVQVFNNDSTSTSYQAFFLLDTSGLDWEISNMNRNITYTVGGETGTIDLQEYAGYLTPLLSGNLLNLEITIIDPFLGLYEGTGDFLVNSGELIEDFGNTGGLATVGIAFNVPIDFAHSFTSMASTKLYPGPGEAAQYPAAEPSTLIIFGSFLIGIGWIVKKQQQVRG